MKGKIVLITGASSGIGAETAKLLAERGAVPVLTGRDERRLESSANAIGGPCRRYRLDVTDDGDVDRVVRLAFDEFGRIDVLVNNAGFGVFERFEDAPLLHFSEMMDTNYMGIVRCAKAVLPLMRQQGDGHIVNVISLAGKIATPKSAGYAASKHAALGLTNAMRMELAPYGIAVSAVNPGPVDTPFFDKADPGGAYKTSIGRYMLPQRRVAETIARVIERRTPEADLPLALSLGIRLYGLMPRLADRVAGRMFSRK
ncbi:SDR family NAD(P)-dependent oxidoreductase [Paenibacillus humicola]|uniref:SDR family NAD(P)-dependent oxidoreductase n=1 Tax=Paenibacillus humicola TaxID=3110540 RepID=UPI00237B7E54|nr:SDR family oxidoreductase [Paenibacillus humicola]